MRAFCCFIKGEMRMRKNSVRIIPLCLFALIVAFSAIALTGCGEISKDTVAVNKLKYRESGIIFDKDRIALEFVNYNKFPVDFSLHVKYYGRDGDYLDERDYTVEAVNGESAYYTTLDVEDDVFDVDFDYECHKTKYKPVKADDMEVTYDSWKLQVKNQGSDTIRDCYCSIVFLDEYRQLISVKNYVFNKIPVGEFKQGNLSAPSSYSTAEVYVRAIY